jgi:SAM-dependent methyltransferase
MESGEPAASDTRQRTSHRLSNGEMNRLLDQDRPAHDWYRFVLSFPPHLVRDYIERFGLCRRHRVLDPFCGTGTTIVECKKRGIPGVGIEANPFAHFVTQVKTDWSPDPGELLQHAASIAERARALLEADGIEDDPVFIRERPPVAQNLRTLDAEVMDLLLANSISPLPLHKTLVLLDCLKQHADPRFEKHQYLALAKALAFSISNLHFGPEVGVGPVKADAPVIAVWFDGVSRIARSPSSERIEPDGSGCSSRRRPAYSGHRGTRLHRCCHHITTVSERKRLYQDDPTRKCDPGISPQQRRPSGA